MAKENAALRADFDSRNAGCHDQLRKMQVSIEEERQSWESKYKALTESRQEYERQFDKAQT
jgi:hypothetical protein